MHLHSDMGKLEKIHESFSKRQSQISNISWTTWSTLRKFRKHWSIKDEKLGKNLKQIISSNQRKVKIVANHNWSIPIWRREKWKKKFEKKEAEIFVHAVGFSFFDYNRWNSFVVLVINYWQSQFETIRSFDL